MNQSQVGDKARMWALVAYALALLLAGDDPALERHAVQALLAGIVAAVTSIALGLTPTLSCAASPLAAVFWLYLVVCGVRAYRGQAVEIPIVCRFVA